MTDYAAGLARNYNGGDYTDWFLPSKDELFKLYLNKEAIGSFSAGGGFGAIDGIYWSSSESSKKHAWYQYFHSGYMGGLQGEYENKYQFYKVRAVRYF